MIWTLAIITGVLGLAALCSWIYYRGVVAGSLETLRRVAANTSLSPEELILAVESKNGCSS